MDTAVSLVQSYLYMNGFFTVTEYPVLEFMDTENPRTLTDVDVLAVRFPGAGSISVNGTTGGFEVVPDPVLAPSDRTIDVIIGEVKEGAADLNRAARDPLVLRAAIGRVGKIKPDVADLLVRELIETGNAMHPGGIRLRLMVFASKAPTEPNPRYTWCSLGHIMEWMTTQLRNNWEIVKSVQSNDPALSFMLLHEKALRGEE
ncbi:MAG: hypothetical protein M5U23_05475 [Acidimicrobiia bacterium]|nr:hypothetical protein [Acidimicrobiia bacterium]